MYFGPIYVIVDYALGKAEPDDSKGIGDKKYAVKKKCNKTSPHVIRTMADSNRIAIDAFAYCLIIGLYYKICITMFDLK
jgi:hypothetical protein